MNRNGPGKRRRPAWSSIMTPPITIRSLTATSLLLLALCHTAASQFSDCLESLVLNDRNGDLVLNPLEFQSFVDDISEGRVRLDMASAQRTPIHQSFDVRVDQSTGGVDIAAAVPGTPPGAGRDGLELFCENVYQSFFPFFDAFVNGGQCANAITGFVQDDGEIDSTDFEGLALLLTGRALPGGIGNATATVFIDFANTAGVIEESTLSSDPSLANLFCRRTVLGVRLDDVEYTVDIPGTLANGEEGTFTYAPTQFPTSFLSDCLDELRNADGNDDELLSQGEYTALVNTLSLDAFLFETFDQLPFALRNNYAWLQFGSSEIEIRGVDSDDLTSVDLRQLRWVCTQTEASISVALNSTNQSQGSPFLTDCIITAILSDVDNDDELDFDEFQSLATAILETNFTLSGASEILLNAFASVSNGADIIDVTGAGQYEIPRDSDLLKFEDLCDSILELSEQLDTNQTNNNTTNIPTFAPTNSTEPPTLIGNATLAPTFVNDTTTLAPTAFNSSSGTVTSTPTLAPSEGNSPGTVGNETSIPTQAPTQTNSSDPSTNATSSPTDILAPTSAPSETNVTEPGGNETGVPSQVLEPTIAPTLDPLLTFAPTGFETSPPTMNPAGFRQCTLSMLVSDRTRDDLLQPGEFVTFLNRISGNAFPGASFDALDPAFRTLYDTLRQTALYPSVAGSKPSAVPPTPEQTANLMRICMETERVYSEYTERIQNQPTSPPTSNPTDSSPGGSISEAELSQCKLFLFVSDSDFNLQLQQQEYVAFVNRLTRNAFTGRSYVQLPFIFQEIFESSSQSTPGYISTVGARSGQQASSEQLAALRNFCIQSYIGARTWEELETDQPTQAPTTIGGLQPPTSQPTSQPTPPPLISASEFLFCTNSLAVNDQDRNNLLDQTEYVGFLNRLTTNKYFGMQFNEIDSVLQSNFFALAETSGSIKIGGARPGPRTQEQSIALLRICSETDKIIEDIEQGVSPPSTPTSPPTIQPTVEAFSSSDLNQCKAFISVSDLNFDQALSPTEYVGFIRTLTRDAYFWRTFSDLDVSFQLAFSASQSEDGTVKITGSLPGDSPSPEESESLRSFCVLVFDALDEMENRPPPTSAPTNTNPINDPITRACMTTLAATDLDGDESVNQLEYTYFVSQISGGGYGLAMDYSLLPYVLRDNYEWISGGSPSINVDGLEDWSNSVGTIKVTQAARRCQRTITVVESALAGNNETLPDRHCYASLTAADSDGDNLMNETEFVFFIDYFQGLFPSTKTFGMLHGSYKNFFQRNKGTSSGEIDIEGSKPNDTPNPGQTLLLVYLCNEMTMAVEDARRSYHFLRGCSDALAQANTDFDNSLTQNEYVDFVYFYAGQNPGNRTFDDLPVAFWTNFDELKSPNTELIEIDGWSAVEPSEEVRANLQSICTATYTNIMVGFPTDLPSDSPTTTQTLAPTNSSTGPSTVTIYNGFLLGSADDLSASSLRNADISTLESAYKQFVNTTTAPLFSGRRLRGRILTALEISLDSAKIYQFLDTACPQTVEETVTGCLQAFASFDISVSNDSNQETIVTEFTSSTQSAIKSGALQQRWEEVNPNRRFDVVGVTDTVRPGMPSPTSSPVSGTSAPTSLPGSRDREDSGGGMGVIIILIAVVLVVIAALGGCVWYVCFFRRRNKQSSEEPTNNNMMMEQKNQFQGEHPGDTDMEDGHSSDFGAPAGESIEGNVPPGHPNSLLRDDTDHDNLEPNFDIMPISPQAGRTRLETIKDGPGWSPSSPASPAQPYTGENPWGAPEVPAGMLPSPGSEEWSSSSSNSDDVEEVYLDSNEQTEAPGPSAIKVDPIKTFGNESSIEFEENSIGEVSEPPKEYEEEPVIERSSDDESEAPEERGVYEEEEVEVQSSDEEEEEEVAEEKSSDDEWGQPEEYEEEAVEESKAEEEELEESEEEEEVLEEEEIDSESGSEEDDTIVDSYVSMTTEERRAQMKYRVEIETLVRQVVPDEVDNVDVMMEQFFGREEELIATLRNMAEQADSDGDEDEEEEDEYSESYEDEEEVQSESQYEEEESYYDEDVSESAYEEEYDEETVQS